MKKEADIWIGEAEALWLSQLEHNAKQVFNSSWLPSHDHTHHRRVWNLCRRLIREMDRLQVAIDYSLVEGILIAAWFHDLGMASTTGEKHGATGRSLCASWLRNNTLPAPQRYREIMDAIEFHDIKDARTHEGIIAGASPGILPVLSVADDLEALGVIGIYRYTEIYLLRGIGMDRLGEKVLQNVAHRMENLASCTACGKILSAFESEQQALTDFFKAYVRQLSQYPDTSDLFTGPAGVVNQIRILGLEKHVRPEAMVDLLPEDRADDDVFQYFKKLKNDWIQARC
ncbi:MAG: hypothetical protein ACWGNV_14105 [Bacteroidales bacterium]